MFCCICYWNMTQRATFLSQRQNAAFPFGRRGSNSGNPNTRLQSCSKHTSKGGIIACLNKSEPKCAEAAEELSLTHSPPAITCRPFIRSGKFPSLFLIFWNGCFKKKTHSDGHVWHHCIYTHAHLGEWQSSDCQFLTRHFVLVWVYRLPRSLWSVFENTSLKCYGEVAPYWVKQAIIIFVAITASQWRPSLRLCCVYHRMWGPLRPLPVTGSRLISF